MRAHRRRREQTKAGVGAAWEMWHAALLMVVAPSPCEPATRVHVRGKQSAPSGACLSCVLACERERNAIVRPPTNKLVGRRKRDPRNLLQTRSPFTQSSPERDVQNKTRQTLGNTGGVSTESVAKATDQAPKGTRHEGSLPMFLGSC